MMQRSSGGLPVSAERASLSDVAAARKRLVSIYINSSKGARLLETSNEKNQVSNLQEVSNFLPNSRLILTKRTEITRPSIFGDISPPGFSISELILTAH